MCFKQSLDTKIRRCLCADAQMCVDVKTRRYVQICVDMCSCRYVQCVRVSECTPEYQLVDGGARAGAATHLTSDTDTPCRYTPPPTVLKYIYLVQIYTTTTLYTKCRFVDIHQLPQYRYKYLVQICTTTTRYTKCRSVDIHQLPQFKYTLYTTTDHRDIF